MYEPVKQQFKKACERSGVKDATLHDLRAKSITDAKKQGHDPQKLAGHSDARMTERCIRLREIDVAQGPALAKITADER